MKHINIEQLSNGELTQQINREMEAVARNIADPNTEAKTTRKITVTITMKPNEQRDFITTSITTKSTLAPTLGAVTALGIRKSKWEKSEIRFQGRCLWKMWQYNSRSYRCMRLIAEASIQRPERLLSRQEIM